MIQPALIRSFALLCGFVAFAVQSSAGTIGYWRMEQDLDPSAEGLQVANEVAGNDLFSATAFIDANLPTTSVPLTGTPNIGSIGGTRQGGNEGINGTVAAYAALDAPSITIEFWSRTVENQAELFQRTTGNNGILIDSPSQLTATWYVDDGAGGAVAMQMSNVFDMDANWHHFAFSYDHLTGLGEFFVDAVKVAEQAGVAGRALVWDPAAPVEIGRRMDYAAAFNGTMDEVRIDDTALGAAGSGGLLLTPEPGSGLLVGLGLLVLGARRSRS